MFKIFINFINDGDRDNVNDKDKHFIEMFENSTKQK